MPRVFRGHDGSSVLAGSALLSLCLILAAPTLAQERVDAAVQGGPGGTYFEYACGPGRLLVGLHGSAGVVVDAVQAVCARVDAVGTTTDTSPEGPVFGGARAFDKAVDCPSQQAIRRIEVSQTENDPLIGAIRITCWEVARLADGGSTNLDFSGTGHLRFYSSPQLSIPSEDEGYFQRSQCPDPLYAIGIRGRASSYLNALGLICGPKPTESAGLSAMTTFGQLIGQEVSFQAGNFLDRFIRHRNWLGFTEPVTDDLARKDSTFRIVPGLAGKCVSLESHNFPNHFLRHHFWRIKLSAREDSDQFRNDATFCLVSGLANTAALSLESANNPGHFIRHRNNELWVDRFDGSDLFRKDATFNVTHPGGAVIVQ